MKIDKRNINLIKKLYFQKLRDSHIYGVLSRKIKSEEISETFGELSYINYSHSNNIELFINNYGLKISRIKKFLVEYNAFWFGVIIFRFGKAISKYFLQMEEKKNLNLLSKIQPDILKDDTFKEIINETSNNLKKIKSF